MKKKLLLLLFVMLAVGVSVQAEQRTITVTTDYVFPVDFKEFVLYIDGAELCRSEAAPIICPINVVEGKIYIATLTATDNTGNESEPSMPCEAVYDVAPPVPGVSGCGIR